MSPRKKFYLISPLPWIIIGLFMLIPIFDSSARGEENWFGWMMFLQVFPVLTLFSLILGIKGIILIRRAVLSKEKILGLVVATLVASSLFLLGLYNLIYILLLAKGVLH